MLSEVEVTGRVGELLARAAIDFPICACTFFDHEWCCMQMYVRSYEDTQTTDAGKHFSNTEAWRFFWTMQYQDERLEKLVSGRRQGDFKRPGMIIQISRVRMHIILALGSGPVPCLLLANDIWSFHIVTTSSGGRFLGSACITYAPGPTHPVFLKKRGVIGSPITIL